MSATTPTIARARRLARVPVRTSPPTSGCGRAGRPAPARRHDLAGRPATVREVPLRQRLVDDRRRLRRRACRAAVNARPSTRRRAHRLEVAVADRVVLRLRPLLRPDRAAASPAGPDCASRARAAGSWSLPADVTPGCSRMRSRIVGVLDARRACQRVGSLNPAESCTWRATTFVAVDAERHARHLRHRPDEQRRADEQRAGERDFGDDESLIEAARGRASCRARRPCRSRADRVGAPARSAGTSPNTIVMPATSAERQRRGRGR